MSGVLRRPVLPTRAPKPRLPVIVIVSRAGCGILGASRTGADHIVALALAQRDRGVVRA